MKKILFLTLTSILTLSFITGCSSSPDKKQAEPTSKTLTTDCPAYPELVIYKGLNYFMTADDSSLITKEMVGEKIGSSSDFLDFKETVDKALLSKELANSISQNAIFYKMNGYSDKFRILIEINGVYNICENSQINKNDMLEYKNLVEKATVNNNSLTKEFKEIKKEDAVKLVEIFSKTTKAALSDAEYEKIAQAEVDGKSYQVKLLFKDGSSTKIFVIPELNLVSIGQEYHTSNSLKEDIAFTFDGLPQEVDNIVQ